MSQRITDTEKAAFLDRTTELLNRVKYGTLAMPAVLAGLQKLVEGKFGSMTVDLDADPLVSDDLGEVVVHRRAGMLNFDLANLTLYLSKDQMGGRVVTGTNLNEELKDKPVLNANLLDWLLKPENQHLIPMGWAGKSVFFWGTIYRRRCGDLCVRYLYRSRDGWDWRDAWFRDAWHFSDPAVVLSAS